jgi:hypothetical protein
VLKEVCGPGAVRRTGVVLQSGIVMVLGEVDIEGVRVIAET